MKTMSDSHRRSFLKSSLIGSVSLLTLSPFALSSCRNGGLFGRKQDLDYTTRLEVPTRLFDGERCWVHPRAGLIPGAGKGSQPRIVMTLNTLELGGSDVFKGMYTMYSDDLGKTWTEPALSEPLAPRMELIAGEQRPVAASDFWPTWHAKSGKLLGTGHTIAYTTDWKVSSPRPRDTAYSVYDPLANRWSVWEKLKMPDNPAFQNAGAGCVQRYDLPDGSILLPIYFSPPGENSRVTVAKCRFDGSELIYLAHGNELSVPDQSRGLHEPSLTFFGGKYFLTIRNDIQGYVSRSTNGVDFEPIQPWRFDDGQELGNYNTQQHWVTHSEGLFLVYTRRGANNDHVFRHRAPLFMGQVDPDRMVIIRETERILVPERGARLGNFGVTEISPEETWVTVSEWMQPEGVDKYGSDGSVFVARVRWNLPNKNDICCAK
ncbi:sialidase family protein [Lunatimonas salinarum]|uniref:sialidase family protein n=1 Tax=Lunatimonas salinarum TaxID=1774590 RepID=UPI001AE00B71|nr:sialidase family protein [Lunatimonas salinarum]